MRPALLATVLSLCAASAQSAEISVLGVFTNKAMLVVDGKPSKVYSVGSTLGGDATLVAVSRTGITFEEGGKRHTLEIGQYDGRTSPKAAENANSISAHADARGHYIFDGTINGLIARMMVDTGATLVALPSADAVRFGIEYKKGRKSSVSTANGHSLVYVVRLKSLRLGGIELFQIDALVQEGGLDVILLGNNVLNRFEMRRDSNLMTLTKRY